MNAAPYATPEGIRTYLASIRGLHLLREERRLAAARFERMPAYCILGRYVLTEDGRFGELIGADVRPQLDLSEVIPLDEFERRSRRHHGDRWRMSYRTPAPLAPYDRLCSECGRGWTYMEISDVVEERDVRTFLLDEFAGMTYGEAQDAFMEAPQALFLMELPPGGPERDAVVPEDASARFLAIRHMHAACHAEATARDRLWWGEDALDRAGFLGALPMPCTPPAKGDHEPWFRLETPRGIIRFGRRPPGYGIDWSDTGVDLTGRFCRIVNDGGIIPVWNEPPVPNGPYHVQPKDDDYLILYLERLRQALGL